VANERKGIDYNFNTRNVTEYALERLKFAVGVEISSEMAEMYRFNVDYRDYGRRLLFTLERDIASRIARVETVTAKVSVEVPLNCWEHFKIQYKESLPKWFLNEFPIKYKTIEKVETKEFNVRECYPAIAIPRYAEKAFIVVEER